MTGARHGAATARRSQIYRWHDTHGARYANDLDDDLVQSYGDEAGELIAARRLGLCDLSLLGRAGFKGAGAVSWFASRALPTPRPNAALMVEGGGLVARLSHEELLVIEPLTPAAALAGPLVDAFAVEQPARTWPLPRADSHCHFALSGEAAAGTLAQLCAIDLRPERCAAGAVAQTSVARLNAIVLRTFCQPTPLYYVLADVSAAEYLWGCLREALAADDGAIIGAQALRDLAAPTL